MSVVTQQLSVDQLVGVEHFRHIEEHLLRDLAEVKKSAAEICIYRPLHAYSRLRRISTQLGHLKPQLDAWHSGCKQAIGNINVTTMGQVVTAPVIMLSMQMRLLDAQREYGDLCSQLNTLKAFTFGVFALYVSMVSLLVTVALGILPFLGK